MIKSSSSILRGRGFNSPLPYDSSQPFVTLVPGNSKPSSVATSVVVSNTHTHKINTLKLLFKKKIENKFKASYLQACLLKTFELKYNYYFPLPFLFFHISTSQIPGFFLLLFYMHVYKQAHT